MSMLEKKAGALSNSLQRWFGREPQPGFIYVYVCYFCGEEFTLRESLQSHQSCCNMIPPIGGPLLTPKEEVLPETAQGQTQISDQIASESVQVYDDRVASSQTLFKSDLTTYISPTRGHLKQSLTPLKTPGTPASPYATNKVSKAKYLTGLGLVPIQKARRVSMRRRSTRCENIDLAEDALPSPSKPRTPKLLISHLSRDESGSGAEFSRSCTRSLFSFQDSKIDEEVEGSGGIEDMDNHKAFKADSPGKPQERLQTFKSLFNIAISSPLGQFVSKHYKGDSSLHVISDIECHCSTEVSQNQEGLRLRARHPVYPITFRGYQRVKDFNSFHQYNFNKEHKKKFLRRVQTGLDCKSRALSKQMRKCKVVLTRLSKAELNLWMSSQNLLTINLKHLTPQEIVYWTRPKPDSDADLPAVFPSGLNLASPNLNKVLGLRTTQDINISSKPLGHQLSVSNFVSEEAAAEATENRRTVLSSLLADLILKGEVRRDKPEMNSQQLSSQCGIDNYSTLRRLLSASGDVGPGRVRTLPDITNLAPAARCKTLRVSVDQLEIENIPGTQESEVKAFQTKTGQIVQFDSHNRKLCEAIQPISLSTRLSVAKSTKVRLAEEGENIAILDSLQTHNDSYPTSPIEKVFPDNFTSNIIPVSTPSQSSAPNSDKRSNSESSFVATTRTLRKRPSKICISDPQQVIPSKETSSSHQKTEESSNVAGKKNMVIVKDTQCPDSAHNVKSTLGPTNLKTRSRSGVGSVSSNQSIPLQKQNPALRDFQFRKRLWNAGLILRAPRAQTGQENKAGTRNDAKPVNSKSTKLDRALSSKVGSTGGKRLRRLRNQTDKRSTAAPINNVFHTNNNLNPPHLESTEKPSGNSACSEWSKEVVSHSLAKQCLGSHNRSLFNHLPIGEKLKRSVSCSDKRIASSRRKAVFTAFKARLNPEQSSPVHFKFSRDGRKFVKL